MLLNLKELTPEEEVDYRYDCPYCGGKNRFSVIRISGRIFYHCFGASCKTRGIKSYTRTLEDIKRNKTIKEPDDFVMQDYFEFGPVNDEIIKTLRDKNSWEAYERGYIKIGYDPKEDRLLFYLLTRGKITGAVGRALRHNPYIKSKIYMHSRGIFSAGIGRTAVLVEDCFSACSVSRSTAFTGISLNGTNLNKEHLTELKSYDKVIIALDKDATRKAIKLYKQLSFIGINAKVKNLEQDLKDCTELPIL